MSDTGAHTKQATPPSEEGGDGGPGSAQEVGRRTRPGLLRRLARARGAEPRSPGEAASEQRPSLGSPPPQAPEAAEAERDRSEATTIERSGSGEPTPPSAPETRAGAGEIGSEARPTQTSPITADPAPLGLAGFALTTFVLSLFESGLLPRAGEPVVFGLALAYGGLAQLLAGMWEFRAGNTFAATAFTSFGAFWISFFMLEVFFADRIPADDLPLYLGWTLVAWAIFTTYMYIASFKVTGAVNIVFMLIAATFYLLGVGDVIGAEVVTRIGGFVGLVTAAAAWYASFATVTNETFRQKVLPVKELD